MLKGILKNEGVLFIIKFLGLFGLLYYFCLFFISITTRGSNDFTVFLRDYLNYIDWIRYSVLRTSQTLCKLFGIHCYIQDRILIRSVNTDKALHMGYDCIGYGVMSFWTAFIVANQQKWLSKLYWVLGGSFLIWIINCMRVTILMVALNNNWPISEYLDHHTLFNIVAYCLLFILIFYYIKSNDVKKK